MGRDNIKVIAVVVLAILATAALFIIVPSGHQRFDVSEYVPARDVTAAKHAAEAIRTQNFADLNAMLAPEFGEPDSAAFAKMGSFVPNKPVKDVTVAFFQVQTANGMRTTRIDLYYDYGAGGVSQVQTLLSDMGPEPKLMGIHVNLFPAAAVQAFEFHWPARWNDPRWGLLAIAAALDLFAFITFGLCAINSEIRWRWRWLWMLLALVSVGRLNISWMTLQVEWLIVNATVPPAGFYRFAAYAPWILSLSLPVGAAVYWARVRSWKRERVERPVAAF